MNREQIYAGVFAFFSAIADENGSALFKTATRKLTDWEHVEAENCPALLQLQKREVVARPRGLPSRWTFYIDLYMYVHTGASLDPSLVPSQILNPLLDAVEASLTVDDPANNACTLGGIVSSCIIDGNVEIYEGNLGDQAVAIIPLTIVVPS